MKYQTQMLTNTKAINQAMETIKAIEQIVNQINQNTNTNSNLNSNSKKRSISAHLDEDHIEQQHMYSAKNKKQKTVHTSN
jgi:hypothetical protein